jgi:peptidoglycan/xylan/chitin deacetylase (PgdA/CDA1 family)
VALDEVPRLLAENDPSRPFLAVTFDDGYRDTLEQALPVLRRHGAPATVFVTPGFADRTTSLWWTDLEDAIAASSEIRCNLGDGPVTLAWRDDAGRQGAFDRLYWALRNGPEARLRSVIAGLARDAGIDPLATVDRLCLDWDGIRELAADPLITIGAHTMTHPMLAKHDDATARAEVEQSRAVIEREIGRAVRHLAYPVGDPTSAGPREFTVAADLRFATAVTTRPGMLFAEHSRYLTALPRLSVNGNFQDPGQFEVLLSGVPFLLWNRGRRVNAD